MTNVTIPTYRAFMNPTLQALKELGGSATIEELNRKIIEITGLTDEQLEVLHDPEKGWKSEVEYRMAWTRTYLKKYGLLENSSRGVWALTPKGRTIESVDPKEVSRYVREKIRQEKISKVDEDEPEEEINWRDELLETLLNMDPSSFERLIQRMLREAGFIQVQVTGRTGDGGIDGNGIMRLAGMLSFQVIFQCKRYKGSVNVSQVRDFRGAMVGRADKGLLITTGNFTNDAMKETTRDGAPAIDLIDGDTLMDRLKELGLGVKTEKIEIEQVTVNKEWLLSI